MDSTSTWARLSSQTVTIIREARKSFDPQLLLPEKHSFVNSSATVDMEPSTERLRSRCEETEPLSTSNERMRKMSKDLEQLVDGNEVTVGHGMQGSIELTRARNVQIDAQR